MLEIIHASLRRGRRDIVDDVSLALRPGTFLALIGPNGAGKSSALKLLSGATATGGGEARLDGMPLDAWDRTELARRRAVLSQGIVMAFGFRVLEVVEMGRAPWLDHGREANRRIARAALAEVGMLALADRDYQTLSGGEQQRVQLARVLAQVWLDAEPEQPGYLLLDEPVTGLDPAHQHAVLGHARRRARQGFGVLAVLHDLNLASQYADRVAVMCGGRILCDGSPDEIFTAERIHRAFGVTAEIDIHAHTRRPRMVMWSQAPT